MGVEIEIKKLIENEILNLGFESVDVKYSVNSGQGYLSVIIDKSESISLNEIVEVTDLISPLLDQADLIKEKYVLDVTSLGAEKPIKVENLDKYVGKYINIHLTNPFEGENYLEGTLESSSEDQISLSWMVKTRKKVAQINKSTIDRARLAIKF